MTGWKLSSCVYLKSNQGRFNHFWPGIVGGLSKLTASATLYPFILIKLRQQSINNEHRNKFDTKLLKNSLVTESNYSSFSKTVLSVARNEGATGFYKGFLASAVKSVLNSAMFFHFFEKFKKNLE